MNTDLVIVTGTGRGPAEPDQVAAARQLAHLRDECARAESGSAALDGPEIRRTAAALLDRATANDSNAAYGVEREGVTAPVTGYGMRPEALEGIIWRLDVKYRQRSLGGWIAGLAVSFLCLPVGSQVDDLNQEEADAYYTLAGAWGCVMLVILVACLIGLISTARANRARRRAYEYERRHLLAELQYADAYLRDRHAQVDRARAEAETVHRELSELFDRA